MTVTPGNTYVAAANSKLRFDLSDQSDIMFGQSGALANAQFVVQHVPPKLFIDYMKGLRLDLLSPPGVESPAGGVPATAGVPGPAIQPNWTDQDIIDFINGDMGTYNFYTRYGTTRAGPALASYTPALFGGPKGIDQWEIPEPTIIINIDGTVLPQPDATYPEPWSLEAGGPNAACHFIASPLNKDEVRSCLIAKDSGQTWVDREKVFDTPQGTLAALQGNKIDFVAAACEVIINTMLVLFPPTGQPTQGEALLLGIMPVHPPPATISPQDYSAVPYNGNQDPNSADFRNYQLRVAREWISRQDAMSCLGPSLVNLCISTGILYGLRDIISGSPVDPDTKLILMSGSKANPLGHVPTYLQTAIILMLKGLRFFGMQGDTGYISTVAYHYMGLNQVTSTVAAMKEFPAIVNQAFAAATGVWRALDRKQTLILSNDVDGQGIPSKFGALLKKYAGSYPSFKDPTQWNDLGTALKNGLTTGTQLYNLARDGLMFDPAIQDELVTHPNSNAVNQFLQFPNAQLLLDAYNKKLPP